MKNTFRKEIFMGGQLFYEGCICTINQEMLTFPIGLPYETRSVLVGCHATLVEINDEYNNPHDNWHLFEVVEPNSNRQRFYMPLKLVNLATQTNKLPVVNKIIGVL